MNIENEREKGKKEKEKRGRERVAGEGGLGVVGVEGGEVGGTTRVKWLWAGRCEGEGDGIGGEGGVLQ